MGNHRPSVEQILERYKDILGKRRTTYECEPIICEFDLEMNRKQITSFLKRELSYFSHDEIDNKNNTTKYSDNMHSLMKQQKNIRKQDREIRDRYPNLYSNI